MNRLFAPIIAVLLLGLSLPATAQDLTGFSKEERASILRFAVNNSLFTLYHEVGHLLIDKMQLPVLGREEDAADNIATWIMLDKNDPDSNQALEDAAKGWLLTGRSYGDHFDDDDYASGYSPDKQRALQIVCLMVGADGSAFRRVANAYAIAPQRQHTCMYDYELIDRSVRGLLDGSQTGSRVSVTYHDVDTDLRLAQRIFRHSGIFDLVAEEVRSNYKLAGTVRFTAVDCGEANAFYDPATTEIIFCYELMQDFMQLYADELRKPRRRLPDGD